MTKLVGILNITPDSFSDGGQFDTPLRALRQARKLFDDGAAFIDIGAESTRPNAEELSPSQEWSRLSSVLSVLYSEYPGRLSLDTYHPETVARVFKQTPLIINDVTGMNNPKMVEMVIKYKAHCIISHLPGVDIQLAHKLMPAKNKQQVIDDLLERERQLIERGLPKANIILDPGIGFGKTPELNRELLEFAKYVPGHSVMIGYSRKRFLGEDRMSLQPNLEAGRIAIAAGADFLRVHDVAGHRQLLE